jgi:sugar O-acyltransferase (sialic acid O-acetyltransferase NeuD family)
MENIVIWGASGHALVVADIIRSRGEYQIIGFLDSVNPQRRGTAFCGSRVLGGEEQLDILRNQGVRQLVFGFGDCKARLTLMELAKGKGFQLVSAIHPNAVIASDVILKPGTVVAACAVINPGSQVGENAIINTSASIDHECQIGDGAHICPGVHLGGRVIIGRGTWIGIGACVSDHINIGNGSLIGAGSVVLDDIPDHVVAYGNPAKVMKRTGVD